MEVDLATAFVIGDLAVSHQQHLARELQRRDAALQQPFQAQSFIIFASHGHCLDYDRVALVLGG
ncbi:hypothetical protein D3C78_1909370 [compost metagenome]